MLKDEVDSFFKVLPTLDSPIRRNQSAYRIVLNAMNRSLEDIQDYRNFYVLNNKNIKAIESVYATVERNHLCYTLLDTFKLLHVRRRICHLLPKTKRRRLL